MEVHHHPHTSIGRQKWTHYLWEFLMLFIAVFCGFLAENQREHMVEHQRANEYALSLYEELKIDTESITKTINDNIKTIGKLDTFCLFSREKFQRKINNGMLYYYDSYATQINNFTSNNTTVEQLKGSGSLRIMGRNISQKISEYGKKLSELDNEYRLSRVEFQKIEDLSFKIFDGYIKVVFFYPDRDQFRDSVFKLNIPLINNDTTLMKEFVGWLKFEAHIYDSQNKFFLIQLKQSATELMALLNKEFKLE